MKTLNAAHKHGAVVGRSAVALLALALVWSAPVKAQQRMGEPLLEVPLHKIPKGVSYEDYQNANRRVAMAAFYGIIPGGVHRYANERTTGWVLTGTAAAGIAAIIVGVGLTEDGALREGYATTTIDENTFYRIPVELNNDVPTFELEKAEPEKKLTAAGGALLGTGIALVIGSYVWDIFFGIHVIEQKRDKARYKIGQMDKKQADSETKRERGPRVKLAPMIDPHRAAAGLQLKMEF